MKNLKIMIAATMLLTGAMALAQDNTRTQKDIHPKSCCATQAKDGTNARSEHYPQQIKEQLNLTDEQVTKIQSIKEKRAAEKKELQKKIRELNMAEREEINQVLTDEQKAKLKEVRSHSKKSQTERKAVEKKDLQKDLQNK
ncbi:MAG: hypothetical protein H3C31_08640 [Brumimicrobium sp.]|nr:hypothetical protein [Brumimicrobium sp.]MCO5269530.1 hypothetical protein [Brumimicrobium sp.]